MDLGKDVETSELDSILESMKPEQCALLIYTVGSIAYHVLTILLDLLIVLICCSLGQQAILKELCLATTM